MATLAITTVSEARAVANEWLMSHLPDRFTSGIPDYDQTLSGWRIPLWFSYPQLAPLGPVGELLVESVGGNVKPTQLIEAARHLGLTTSCKYTLETLEELTALIEEGVFPIVYVDMWPLRGGLTRLFLKREPSTGRSSGFAASRIGECSRRNGLRERGIGDIPRPPDMVNKGSQLSIGRKVTAYEGKIYIDSMRKPSMRSKWRRLLVRRVRSYWSAVAAIIRSISPMR